MKSVWTHGMTKERIDVLVARLGLAESREQAQRLIMAGQVLVDGHAATKAGARVDETARIELKARPRFVSRGGDKLEGAFKTFALDVHDLVCLDAGASTGGFTDCLLQHGAARVYAVDVGRAQLHPRIAGDPRVVVLDEINARNLSPADIPEPAAFACIDVSFISLTKVLPAVIQVLAPCAAIVALIKPQFEAGREQVGRGGVVRDDAVRQAVVDRVRQFCVRDLGLAWRGVCESPLRGPAGNVEYLAWMTRNRENGGTT
jgi:23S rRNA (cytidine1920-2'-O)/16S rRNA (cytidine1409-2'-O)-methyltransferase